MALLPDVLAIANHRAVPELADVVRCETAFQTSAVATLDALNHVTTHRLSAERAVHRIGSILRRNGWSRSSFRQHSAPHLPSTRGKREGSWYCSGGTSCNQVRCPLAGSSCV